MTKPERRIMTNDRNRKTTWIPKVSIGAIAVIGMLSLLLWLQAGSSREISIRVEIPENALTEFPVGLDGFPVDPNASLSGQFMAGEGKAAVDIVGSWPWFRGVKFDGVNTESLSLAREFGPEGPEVRWQVKMGEGYASAAILNGQVYVLDYDFQEKADTLRCLSLADGKEIWRFSYPVRISPDHGVSRTIPAVTEEYIVTIGPKCHVLCLDLKTLESEEKKYWMKDLVREYQTVIPDWFAGQCPLIENGKVILAPGGKALMIAVDCATGEVLWETPNPRKWKMTHSSITPMEFKGTRMYVYWASGGVAGVSAEDGKLLWETDQWNTRTDSAPSPVLIGEGRLFLSGFYNAGAIIIQLEKENGVFQPRIVTRLKQREFGSRQQTPIFYQDYIYGVRPDKRLVCLDRDGNIVWESGADKFGWGPYLIADGLIYVMDDDGVLTIVEATSREYRNLCQYKVLSGKESWGPMALVSGRLLVRDMETLACLDISAK
jgi:outer membrane protein assembly factor BamB